MFRSIFLCSRVAVVLLASVKIDYSNNLFLPSNRNPSNYVYHRLRKKITLSLKFFIQISKIQDISLYMYV